MPNSHITPRSEAGERLSGAAIGLDRRAAGTAPGAAPAFTLAGLGLGYQHRVALGGISGAIAKGSLTAIIGPNGAGKSTLLKGLAGLIAPIEGSIDRHGLDPRAIAYLPQQAEVDRSFPASVFDLVSLGLWRRRGLFGRLRQSDRQEIEAALTAVGLAGLAGHDLDGLSGGQMQRALFARVLLQDAPVILLDEPFNAIDTASVRDLMGIVARWHGEGRTILAVLHDLDLVEAHFPLTLFLAGTAVAWGETAGVIRAARAAGETSRQIANVWPQAAE